MTQNINGANELYPLMRKTNDNRSTRFITTSINNPRLSDVGNEAYAENRQSSEMEFKSINSMHKFAREGDCDKLENLIKYNPANARKYVNTLNAEKMAPLHYAARYNHIKCVMILVEKAHADVNVLTDERVTPMHFAARYRRKWQVEQTLLAKNAAMLYAARGQLVDIPENPNIVNNGIMEPEEDLKPMKQNLVSTLGTKNISEEVKKRLLEEEDKPTVKNSVILYLESKGANPNAQDSSGCTPLHYAAMRGNEVAASQLLRLVQIRTELKDNEKMTALHLACSHNHYEIGRMLLEKNANLFSSEESGCNPFHVACGEGNENLVNLMIKIAEKQEVLPRLLTETNRDNCNALHYAVENNKINVARICLEKGSNVHAVTVTKQTALHMAAHCGSVELVELLISYGAKMDVADKFHRTPMHAAAAKNHVEIIEFLLRQGADTESRDANSYTPLLSAAAFGHVEAIEMLMSNNCDIFAVEKENKNVLYLAIEQNHLEAVKVILADESAKDLLKIPDFNSNFPLHIASKEGREEMVKALLDAGAVDDVKNEDERTPMHLAAKYGRTRTVKYLGQRSTKSLVSYEDEDSNTPLHLAAKSGFPKVIQLLLDLGADINSRNCNKWTAMDCAAAKGNLKASRILLQNYAPVDPMDRSKVTPLYLACKNGHEKLVELLLKNNADVSIKIVTNDDDLHNGCNPLDIAIENGHRECALAIVRTAEWKRALRNQTKGMNGYIDTPMRKLIRKMPDVAAEIFDKCTVTNNKHPGHNDFEITYNFEFLEDSYACWRGKVTLEDEDSEESNVAFSCLPSQIYNDNEKLLPTATLYTSDTKQIKNNHPLTVMVTSEREDLLAHPLVTNLLRMKWNNFGKLVYYINLATFVLFLLSLITYMSHAKSPYSYFLKSKTKKNNETTCDHVQLRFGTERLDDTAYICKYLVLVFCMLGMFKEVIQLIINKKHYFTIENMIEWILYILAVITVIDVSPCQKQIGIREAWQWQTGTVASFLGVINMVLFIRKVPFFGIFVVMFTDVMWTFLKFLPLFLLFIFAFAFSFFLLLGNQVPFRNLANAMLRTTVMMIGEFDFDETFNSQLDESHLDNKLVFYDGVTYIIFVVFIVMMSIVTMNLLVGLAVDDIKAVQEKATLKRLAMQVTLALEVEGLVPEFIRRRFIIRKQRLHPNRRYLLIRKFFGEKTHIKNSWTTVEEDMDPLEKIEMQQKAAATQVSKIKYKLKNLDCQSVTMNKMMTKLLKYLQIDFEEEDILEEEI